jgi:hypothetical protein
MQEEPRKHEQADAKQRCEEDQLKQILPIGGHEGWNADRVDDDANG